MRHHVTGTESDTKDGQRIVSIRYDLGDPPENSVLCAVVVA